MGADSGNSAKGYTQCPSCLTVFHVAAPTLRLAAGQARCGLCGTVFNAAARWRLDLPRLPERDARLVALEPLAEQPSSGRLSGALRPSQASGQAQRRRPAEADASTAAARTSGSARRASRARGGVDQGGTGAQSQRSGATAPPWRVVTDAELEPTRQRSSAYWAVAGSVLALALALQLAWFHRDTLARRPTFYPWVAAACQYLPCAVDPPRQPEMVTIIERVLRRHDERSQALVLAATVSNSADSAQPWPQLGLRLSALNGEEIAVHWFAPPSYRGTAAQGEPYMAPGKLYAVRVVFRRPQREVAGYELRFR